MNTFLTCVTRLSSLSLSVPSLLSVLLIIQDLEEILDLKGKHRQPLADMQVCSEFDRMPMGPGHEDAHLFQRDD